VFLRLSCGSLGKCRRGKRVGGNFLHPQTRHAPAGIVTSQWRHSRRSTCQSRCLPGSGWAVIHASSVRSHLL